MAKSASFDLGDDSRRPWRRRLRRGLALSGLLSIGLAIAVTRALTPALGPLPDPALLEHASATSPLWSFGFVGDTHASVELCEQIFAALTRERVEFVLHLGDMVDRGEQPEQWDRFLAAARRHAVDLRPVVGNHDKLPGLVDNGWACFARHFPELPGTWYAFEHRGLRFVMLNSEQWFSPWTEQGQMVRRAMDDRALPTVVCVHRPLFSASGRDWPRMLLRRFWLHRPLAAGGALAVLSGHNHFYERTRPLDGVTYVTSGGGARNCYESGSPDERTAALVAHKNHYGVVDVHADRLVVRMIDVDGVEFDRFALELPVGASPSEIADKIGGAVRR